MSPAGCALVFSVICVFAKVSAGKGELFNGVADLVRRWAPLVWLAPGERFMPLSVDSFLEHVTPKRGDDTQGEAPDSRRLPRGPQSLDWYLVSKNSIESLLENRSSFLFGREPRKDEGIPVYALVSACAASESSGSKSGAAPVPAQPDVIITYWFFFPYNEGKPLCTLNLGPLGPWPLPLMWGVCLGSWSHFGGHVGDWEHVSVLFSGGDSVPKALYVSAHEAGAFYRWNAKEKHFVFERHEIRRGPRLLQRAAAFSNSIKLAAGHPELFAARGSHGLWARPGRHRYARVPGLYDDTGYGAPWRTWEHVTLLVDTGLGLGLGQAMDGVDWMRFLGRWGNPKDGCHPLSSAICRRSDGPTGIPLKQRPFACPRRTGSTA